MILQTCQGVRLAANVVTEIGISDFISREDLPLCSENIGCEVEKLTDGGGHSKCTEWLHDDVIWQDAPCVRQAELIQRGWRHAAAGTATDQEG